MGPLLVVTGLTASVIALWRSYAAAREAIGPVVHPGEPTRTALEAVRPLHARSRVRLFAARVARSVGWLLVASYGLFLVASGTAVR